MSERIVIPQPVVANRKTVNWSVLSLLFAFVVGATGGWFGQHAFERGEETAFHAEQLRPWLEYDPDYWKLQARSLNDDHRRVAFLVYQAYRDRCNLRQVLDQAMPVSDIPPALKELTIARLLENHEQALRYGLYTPENLRKMAEGKAPYATLTEFAGERMDSEHIVPKAVVPLVDNLLMNLEWLPQSLNAAKSDTITERAMNYARAYHDSGIMRADDFERVLKRFRERD